MPAPIVVPKLNENDDEVLVVELAVPSGAQVAKGEPLFSVETSKALQEIEAEAPGWVVWHVAAGDRVAVLAPVGWLFATEQERREWEAAGGVDEVRAAAGDDAAAGERPATEPARRLAAELGIVLADLPGDGIVRTGDVQAFAAARGAAAVEPEAEPSAGRLSDELRNRLRDDPESIRALSSEEKIALYREHGAAIGDGVSLGPRSLFDAAFVEIGADTAIGADVVVRARRFAIGELGQIGDRCRFFCRDFVAGDVVTFRWDAVVVDGQGGIHDCHVGDHCFVAYDTYLNTDRDVRLGARVCLSPGARIYTHRKWLEALDGFPFAYAPVEIGERSWLGPGSLVLPGVTLGAEVTVMANSVVAFNAPAGALVGGTPATVLLERQRQDLDAGRRLDLLAEILDESVPALAQLGWTLERGPDGGGAGWSGTLTAAGGVRCRLVAAGDSARVDASGGERLVVLAFRNADALEPSEGLTVFDLEAKSVRGARDGAADAVRHALFKYGMLFEPSVWRYGARMHETVY